MIRAAANMPQHVAIIMDGNGRWAQSKGLVRIDGHNEGAKTVRDITTHARELGIPFLTLYSFSAQNWLREPAEVSALMVLLREYCQKEEETLMNNDIRLETIGRMDRLPEATRQALQTLKETTANNRSMQLTLAVDYGGREELTKAVACLVAEREAANKTTGTLPVVDEALLAKYLAPLPDPDLMIRTSGEQRISNFLLWQLAYAELYFSEKMWPEFSTADLDAALADYMSRQRRYGGTHTDPLQPATSAAGGLRPDAS